MLITLAGVTLGGGGHLGNLTLPGGPRAAFAQFDHYEPFVVVDLADLADPTSEDELYETGYGEAVDVNDQLFACGWFRDSYGYDQPFVLNPLDGGSASHLPMTLSGDPTTTFESGHALAINDPGTYELSDLLVVGWVEEDSNEPRAAYWEHNGTSWELHLVPDLHSANDSYATDVGPEGDYAVGYEIISGAPHPFIYDHSGDPPSTSLKQFVANAMGIDKATEVMTGTRYNQGSPGRIPLRSRRPIAHRSAESG